MNSRFAPSTLHFEKWYFVFSKSPWIEAAETFNDCSAFVV
jgi:hypothetical protein